MRPEPAMNIFIRQAFCKGCSQRRRRDIARQTAIIAEFVGISFIDDFEQHIIQPANLMVR